MKKITKKMLLKKVKGQAYPEYVIAAGVLMAALFLPIVDGPNAFTPPNHSVPVPNPGRMSVAEYIVDAFKRNHQGYIWAMSVPSN